MSHVVPNPKVSDFSARYQNRRNEANLRRRFDRLAAGSWDQTRKTKPPAIPTVDYQRSTIEFAKTNPNLRRLGKIGGVPDIDKRRTNLPRWSSAVLRYLAHHSGIRHRASLPSARGYQYHGFSASITTRNFFSLCSYGVSCL